jgi:hypothetical protein
MFWLSLLMVTMLARQSIIPPSPIAIRARIMIPTSTRDSSHMASICPDNPSPIGDRIIYPQNVEAHPLTLRLIDITRLPLMVSSSDLSLQSPEP